MPEFQRLPKPVRLELLAQARRLARFGPGLGRSAVDTLAGSRHANMKELRFRADDGIWRVAFAFDPRRIAVLLAAGDKSGASGSRFYRRLVATADRRLDRHLNQQHEREE
ncbi:MAG: type II toxin-antitoxin system RelE/ParE family toxin [Thalassobaculum sp.]|uniref:type II toxin-antitoxin system RelE/ParE family toxin n=1 Tax=Thalassobaculum sp. TaxID=2022740 RepID=UPI0032EBC3AE